MSSVELMKLIKGNVLSIKPYHVESFDCETKLHANENPFPPSKELLELFSTSFQNSLNIESKLMELKTNIDALKQK